jgi:hypothetical protein
MSNWYIVVKGQTRGPASTETMLGYLKTRDRAQTYVWRESFDDWRLAKDVPELGGAHPPPLPLVAVRQAHPVSADGKPQRKPRKIRWFKIGALVGLVYAFIGIVAGDASQQDVFYLGGYISGGVGIFGLVGFIAGVIDDLIHRPAEAELPSGTARALSTDEPVIAGGRRNFIARHWRELPLWVSHWLINFLGNLCAVTVPIVLAVITHLARLLRSRDHGRASSWLLAGSSSELGAQQSDTAR